MAHPRVRIRIRETDLADPTAGLRAGLVDVVLTRTPFDRTSISIRVLRSDPVGVVLRADDPLACRDTLHLRDLEDRRWFQLAEGTEHLWRAYCNGTTPAGPFRDGPVVRTILECVQAVLWSGTIGLAPLTPLAHALPEGLTTTAGRHAAQPARHRLEHQRRQPADPLTHQDRRSNLLLSLIVMGLAAIQKLLNRETPQLA